MIDSIQVQGFKGIKEGSISQFAQVNILTGKNNSGKSSFLQSLYFLNEDRDPATISNFGKKEMFWNYDDDKPIKHLLKINQNEFDMIYYLRQMNGAIWVDFSKYLKDPDYFSTKVSKDPKFNLTTKLLKSAFQVGGGGINTDISSYVNNDLKEFFKFINSSVLLNHSNFLKTSEELSEFLDILQNNLHKEDDFLKILSETYEKKLTKLRHSPHQFKGWSVFLDDGNESRTISFDNLGDGARTSINILLQLFVQEPKIVLIDEIELHQHIKALRNLCQTILLFIKQTKAQLFVSTHNLDAIKLLSEISNQYEMSAMIHHFTLNEGILRSRTIPSLDATTILDLTGDIRFIDEYV